MTIEKSAKPRIDLLIKKLGLNKLRRWKFIDYEKLMVCEEDDIDIILKSVTFKDSDLFV